MLPTFWKLSQGTEYFSLIDISSSIEHKLVYVHINTAAKGQSLTTQGENFINADVGDYFYLTHGNNGICLLGQFTGPVNFFSSKGDGWADRPFRLIRLAISNVGYEGPNKWWSPNHRSTFIQVPEDEIAEFEEHILEPFFGINLEEYGLSY